MPASAEAAASRVSLIDRSPALGATDLVEGFRVPPRFGDVSFDSFEPDPAHPSQLAALESLKDFAAMLDEPPARRGLRFRRRAHGTNSPRALYLDGGFGVGKTHLLASLWHGAPRPAAYLSFEELTATIGFLGMEHAVEAFGEHRLLCIDEFELDDVAETLMTVTFLRAVIPGGTRVVCTSNSLPDRLGDGRFHADDFRREIAAIASHFDVVRIDGPDFRHRNFEPVGPVDGPALREAAQAMRGVVAVDDFAALLMHLRRVHPVQYGALLDDVDGVCVRDLTPVHNQGDALLFVQLVDEIYDADIPFCASGCAVTELFPDTYRHGGYRKKYGRAESRLSAMMAEALA